MNAIGNWAEDTISRFLDAADKKKHSRVLSTRDEEEKQKHDCSSTNALWDCLSKGTLRGISDG
jgi:hypothetical protein